MLQRRPRVAGAAVAAQVLKLLGPKGQARSRRQEQQVVEDGREPSLSGMFGRVALRAMQDALHERQDDVCWTPLRKGGERPDVRAAEAAIGRAWAEAFSPVPPAEP